MPGKYCQSISENQSKKWTIPISQQQKSMINMYISQGWSLSPHLLWHSGLSGMLSQPELLLESQQCWTFSQLQTSIIFEKISYFLKTFFIIQIPIKTPSRVQPDSNEPLGRCLHVFHLCLLHRIHSGQLSGKMGPGPWAAEEKER